MVKPNWFVALPVPAEDWLPMVIADLPGQCRGFVPADVHMTVAFLGAMRADRQNQVIAVMEGIQSHPLEITLGKVLTLPNSRRVSALSFEVAQGAPSAIGLIDRYRDQLIEAGAGRPDLRTPLAHITVARPIRRYGEAGKMAARDWARRVRPPYRSLLLDRVALYTWADNRATRQFKIVHEHYLGSQ